MRKKRETSTSVTISACLSFTVKLISSTISAAKTALLLDNTQLGQSQVSVSSAANLSDLGASTAAHDETQELSDLSQEDKPRSRIVAEYLAHGYTLSDTAIQRAIALDNKHGVSARFTTALSQFDAKYKASDKAKGIDASYGISEKAKGIDASYGLSEKASTGWRGMTSYFEKALGTPTGQKLAAFYTQSDKQVRDIHAEARRLADLKTGKQSGSSKGESEKNSKAENEKTMQQVPGTEKTTCGCGGDTGVCPCGEGSCACSGCSKSGLAGEKSATGPAAEVAASSGVQPLGEKA